MVAQHLVISAWAAADTDFIAGNGTHGTGLGFFLFGLLFRLSGLGNRLILFLSLILHSIKVGEAQGNPAAVKLAPGIAGGNLGFSDCQGFSLVNHTAGGVIGAGALTQIHAVGSDSHLHRINLGGLVHRRSGGIIFHRSVAALHPAGVELHVAHTLIQLGHLVAASLGSIPTGKGVATAGRGHLGGNGIVGIVALDIGNTVTAIEHIDHIAVIVTNSLGIHTVEVHIGLDQTPLDQIGQNLTVTDVAPLSNSEQEFIALDAGDHTAAEGTILLHPGGTKVVCKQQQRIKLSLIQLQTMLIDEAVDTVAKLIGILTQQRISLFIGNTVLTITLIVLIRATRTVTNSPLRVVPAWILIKAFHILNHLNTFVTDDKFRRCRSRNSSRCHSSQQQNHRQQKRNNSFHYVLDSFPFFRLSVL